MSNTDKTGEKLLQTIRDTKAAGTPSGTARTTRKRTATRKATPKPAAATRPQPAATTAAAPTPAASGADPYQAGRRVWPD
jgi:hypothetical protein